MKREVYGIYQPNHDITFIMEELYNDNNEPISLEVKGFYYGEPNDNDIKTFYGDLRADFGESQPEPTEAKEYIAHINIKSTKVIGDADVAQMVAKLNTDTMTCECAYYEEV